MLMLLFFFPLWEILSQHQLEVFIIRFNNTVNKRINQLNQISFPEENMTNLILESKLQNQVMPSYANKSGEVSTLQEKKKRKISFLSEVSLSLLFFFSLRDSEKHAPPPSKHYPHYIKI